MLKIKYIVDATADMPAEFAKENDIHIIGVPVTFEDGTTLVDPFDLKDGEFYKLLESHKDIPKTSQPSLALMQDIFESYVNDYDAIIYITMSSFGSGTYNAANIAKANVLENHPNAKIEIIDSRAYSLFILFMVEEAIKLQKEGKTLKEIVEGAKMRRRYTDICVIVDTLKYLEKGGRINKASLVAGTLLDLKPVLAVRGGVMESIDKFRGSKTVISKMIKKIKTMDVDLNEPRFSIVDTGIPEKVQQIKEALSENFENSEVLHHSTIGATVATHIGPGTFAVFFKTNSPQKVYDED